MSGHARTRSVVLRLFGVACVLTALFCAAAVFGILLVAPPAERGYDAEWLKWLGFVGVMSVVLPLLVARLHIASTHRLTDSQRAEWTHRMRDGGVLIAGSFAYLLRGGAPIGRKR
jgi:hypothetical protein